MAALDDKELIRRLREGDKESFRVIFESNYPLFHSFTYRITRDSDTAQDIVQNVFMRLWIARERIDPDRSLRNYLSVMVRNEIYCHFRTAYTARRTDGFPPPQDAVTPGDNIPEAEKQYDADRLHESVQTIVEAMPARRREIFRLSREEHLSNSQIARRLGISVRTVEKHIELALTEIRRYLNVSIAILIGILW